MTKAYAPNPSVRELKAAALDALVKQELEKTRTAQTSKINRLRALRLARDAAGDISPQTR
jgi:hypothetical protein